MVPSIGSMIQRRSPSPGPVAVLLADDDVAGAFHRDPLADRPLDRLVGLGHGRQVRLRLDHQIGGAEAVERDLVGEVDQLERKREVVGG